MAHGASLKAKDGRGSSPLHFAATHGQTRTLESLLRSGAVCVTYHVVLPLSLRKHSQVNRILYPGNHSIRVSKLCPVMLNQKIHCGICKVYLFVCHAQMLLSSLEKL